MDNLCKAVTVAALLAAAPAAAAAGQRDSSDVGTHIYSPSPLIVHTNAERQPVVAGRNDGGVAVRRTMVKLAEAGSADAMHAGAPVYHPPVIAETRRERIIREINEVYGTRFATHSPNETVAMNGRVIQTALSVEPSAKQDQGAPPPETPAKGGALRTR